MKFFYRQLSKCESKTHTHTHPHTPTHTQKVKWHFIDPLVNFDLESLRCIFVRVCVCGVISAIQADNGALKFSKTRCRPSAKVNYTFLCLQQPFLQARNGRYTKLSFFMPLVAFYVYRQGMADTKLNFFMSPVQPFMQARDGRYTKLSFLCLQQPFMYIGQVWPTLN